MDHRSTKTMGQSGSKVITGKEEVLKIGKIIKQLK